MKRFELETTHETAPIVYVDMDGVLADFFGEVADHHKVKNWKEIHRKDLGIDQVAQQPGFFEDLAVLPNAHRLINGVVSLAGKYSILSSPLLSEVEQSSEEKTEWLKHHFRHNSPSSILFDHEKQKYATQPDGTPNILIDDWDLNIKLWQANGGIGILYQDEHYLDVLKKLRDALLGRTEVAPLNLAVLETDEEPEPRYKRNKIYTNKQVLKYVKGIHHEYELEKPILKHKTWILKDMPVSELSVPEYIHQDDPYRRYIKIDWDHVAKNVDRYALEKKPIVADADGWVLDGNHRVTAARAAGLDSIPALVPYQDES